MTNVTAVYKLKFYLTPPLSSILSLTVGVNRMFLRVLLSLKYVKMSYLPQVFLDWLMVLSSCWVDVLEVLMIHFVQSPWGMYTWLRPPLDAVKF